MPRGELALILLEAEANPISHIEEDYLQKKTQLN
jgi:hypothetical protein